MDIAKMLLDKGPSHVIIKKGAHGSILIENDATIEIPVYPDIKIMDPTGAGDSYAGGLLGYINTRIVCRWLKSSCLSFFDEKEIFRPLSC